MARKILLADDSVTAQNMGRKILADAGYEVITVNNGSAALKKIAEQKPDLIVLDVYMPGYSGLEVCQRLKEAGESARVPVLLTVGKLEPFKPEEAKRVKADGFIVKPFEASELLSALSKLEDKIVPRSELAKPGRLARATAAIEQSGFDPAVSEEEDSGWKNRISFPSKKKEKEKAEGDVDDAAIYNPVNKDLRTTVDHKAAKTDEGTVDLGALAAAGLPKDVTPEEIAALAAAAAQVKATLQGEAKPVAASPEPEIKAEATAEVEVKKPEVEIKKDGPVADPVPTPEAATLAQQEAAKEPVNVESKTESKIESKAEVVASPAEVAAAIAALEKDAVAPVAHPAVSESAAGSTSSHEPDEPVTMAVAALTETGAVVSRWTAVAVALAPGEDTISLEQEMQKALAAFSVAEGEQTVTNAAESVPAPVAFEESAVAVEAAPALASAAAEIVAETPQVAAVVTAEVPKVDVEQPSATDTKTDTKIEPSPAPAELSAPTASEPEAAPVADEPEIVEPKSEPVTVAELQAAQPESVSSESACAEKIEVAVPAPQGHQEQTVPQESVTAAPAVKVPEAVEEVKQVQEEQAHVATSPTDVPPVTAGELSAEGIEDMAKKESQIAENTAAAWASWRRIREAGDAKPASPAQSSAKQFEKVSPPQPKEEAAMAVAVGAESKPEEVAPSPSPESDPEIASIVDSVMADMRPKIVEEIARKLGKKK